MAIVKTSSRSSVVVFGNLGVYSQAVLLGLLKRNVNVIGVVIAGAAPAAAPALNDKIPLAQEPKHKNIELTAIEHNIPITYVLDVKSDVFVKEVADFQGDFFLVACFPHILPERVLKLAKIASLNAHPSLLPAYRGPSPIFWQLRHNESRTGVTLHVLNEDIDAGDIVLNVQVPLKQGMRARAIDALLGDYASILLVEALRLYAVNNVSTSKQDPESASYMPLPQAEDFVISTSWSARHAFSFVRGTADWNKPYKIFLGDKTVILKSVMAFSPSGRIKETYILDDNYITIQFSPGLLSAYVVDIR